MTNAQGHLEQQRLKLGPQETPVLKETKEKQVSLAWTVDLENVVEKVNTVAFKTVLIYLVVNELVWFKTLITDGLNIKI